MRIPSGVTDQVIYFVAVDATDFTTRELGLTGFTVYRSRNGGAPVAMTTPTITEVGGSPNVMPGVYSLLLDEDMTIDAGNDSEEMVFHITQVSGSPEVVDMAPVTRTIELYRPKITAGYTLGVASDGDISGNIDGAVVGAVGSVTADVTIDATSVDLIWDEVITGAAHNVATSAARYLREASSSVAAVTGTAQAGAASTITLEAGASATDDLYNFEQIAIIDGTGAGQGRLITDYVGSTKVATVDRAWTVNPDATSIYIIRAADCAVEAVNGQIVTATGTVDFDDLASILTDTAEIGTAGAGLTALASASNLAIIAAYLDTEIAAILEDTGTTIPALIAALNDITVSDVLTTQMTEAYAADGVAPTLAQAIFLIQQFLYERATSSTTVTVKKLDGSTTAATLTLDDATTPTSITRAT